MKKKMSIKVNLEKKRKQKELQKSTIYEKRKRGELWESNVVSALELDNIYFFIS